MSVSTIAKTIELHSATIEHVTGRARVAAGIQFVDDWFPSGDSKGAWMRLTHDVPGMGLPLSSRTEFPATRTVVKEWVDTYAREGRFKELFASGLDQASDGAKLSDGSTRISVRAAVPGRDDWVTRTFQFEPGQELPETAAQVERSFRGLFNRVSNAVEAVPTP